MLLLKFLKRGSFLCWFCLNPCFDFSAALAMSAVFDHMGAPVVVAFFLVPCVKAECAEDAHKILFF